MPSRPPVVVVGAGPTGVAAALALATHGEAVLLLERRPQVHPLPRAVHVDDEVARVLQGLGVGPQFAAVSMPGLGLRLLDRSHRVLAEFSRDPGPSAHGHPAASFFDQPELERLLRARLRSCPGVRLRTGVEVLSVRPGTGAVLPSVTLRDENGQREQLTASAVLGCDGADSLVRGALSTGWQDLRFAQRWVVLDVRTAVPLDVWPGVSQVCDGRRAATFLQIGPGRYRWEFQLRDGETAAAVLQPDRLAEFLAPWTGGLPLDRLEVLRSSEYVFRARIADRWQCGRVFLLGDAAHQSPPFVGQGLGAGLRDAANLSWKLAAVLQDRAPEHLLDSYQAERRPHALALVRLAVVAGWAMTGGNGPAAALRRGVLAGLVRVPAARRHLLDRTYRDLRPGPLVRRGALPGRSLAGTLAPQPVVRTHRPGAAPGPPRLLDDVLGPGFAVLTAAEPDAALRALADRLRAPVVRVPPGGPLGRWLRSGRASSAVLRPDRVVLATAASRTAPGQELERRWADVLRLVGA